MHSPVEAALLSPHPGKRCPCCVIAQPKTPTEHVGVHHVMETTQMSRSPCAQSIDLQPDF